MINLILTGDGFHRAQPSLQVSDFNTLMSYDRKSFTLTVAIALTVKTPSVHLGVYELARCAARPAFEKRLDCGFCWGIL